MIDNEKLVSEEDTIETFEEQGMPQNPEVLDSTDESTSVTKYANENINSEDKKPFEFHPRVEKGTPIAKRNLNYSCRTTCKQNVVVVTVMKDGSEDSLIFVCNLDW